MVIALFSACKKNNGEILQNFSGYWEIESVVLEDGSKKSYTISQTIDYIQINDSLNGIRKKMNPRFNGTYETSKAVETFQLKQENDSLNVYYKTQYSNWKETILNATKTQLKVVNQNNVVYLYKRYTPIVIN